LVGTKTVRSNFNHIHLSGNKQHPFQVDPGCTANSHFDDIISTGQSLVVGNGVLNYVNSIKDGDLRVSGNINITGGNLITNNLTLRDKICNATACFTLQELNATGGTGGNSSFNETYTDGKYIKNNTEGGYVLQANSINLTTNSKGINYGSGVTGVYEMFLKSNGDIGTLYFANASSNFMIWTFINTGTTITNGIGAYTVNENGKGDIIFSNQQGTSGYGIIFGTASPGNISYFQTVPFNNRVPAYLRMGSKIELTKIGSSGSPPYYTDVKQWTIDGVNGDFLLSNMSGSVNFNLTQSGRITTKELIQLSVITLPACNSVTDGNLGRNATNIYMCNSTCWISWGKTTCG